MAKIKRKPQLYIVSKSVMARTPQEALKLEKNIPPEDVYVDQDWKKNNL